MVAISFIYFDPDWPSQFWRLVRRAPTPSASASVNDDDSTRKAAAAGNKVHHSSSDEWFV
jgi:hypothetical protein